MSSMSHRARFSADSSRSWWSGRLRRLSWAIRTITLALRCFRAAATRRHFIAFRSKGLWQKNVRIRDGGCRSSLVVRSVPCTSNIARDKNQASRNSESGHASDAAMPSSILSSMSLTPTAQQVSNFCISSERASQGAIDLSVLQKWTSSPYELNWSIDREILADAPAGRSSLLALCQRDCEGPLSIFRFSHPGCLAAWPRIRQGPIVARRRY